MSANPIPCSVQVLVRNGMPNIQHCLETLADFDEVIVQDGQSTDGTREVAAKFPNVRILNQDPAFIGSDGRIIDFSGMRNASIAAAKHDWVLVVDADEGIREDLRDEVRSIVEAGTPGVYQAFRRFYVHGEKIERCAGYPAYQIRLFHRGLIEGYRKPIHERIALKPGVSMQILRSELPVPLPPAQELNAKYDRYLRMEVKRLGVMPWGQWLRWILFRNLRSAVGLFVLVVLTWVIPGRGKRMPFAYDWQAIRQSLRTIVATFPLRKRSV
jgi:hypothetical protein